MKCYFFVLTELGDAIFLRLLPYQLVCSQLWQCERRQIEIQFFFLSCLYGLDDFIFGVRILNSIECTERVTNISIFSDTKATAWKIASWLTWRLEEKFLVSRYFIIFYRGKSSTIGEFWSVCEDFYMVGVFFFDYFWEVVSYNYGRGKCFVLFEYSWVFCLIFHIHGEDDRKIILLNVSCSKFEPGRVFALFII